ncbi:GTP-binding protein, partial [Mycoplasmopsis edwardii]
MILEKISNHPHKIAVVSKVSKIKGNPEVMTRKIQELSEYNFEHIVSTDVNNLNSIYSLIDLIKDNYSYEGEAQYDEDYVTDKTVRFLAKEIIRESAINALYDELPHSIAVEILEFNEDDPDHTIIDGIIYVKKDSQKGMVIGKNASKIKEIGKIARIKIMQQLQTKVTLTLKVKVAKKW